MEMFRNTSRGDLKVIDVSDMPTLKVFADIYEDTLFLA